MDSTINWTSELSEGTPIPDYYWFRRDSEIARTEYMSTYLHNLLYLVFGVCSRVIHCARTSNFMKVHLM